MDRLLLELDLHLADGYKSPSQRARRITEGWYAEHMYCVACPSPHLDRTRENTRVVDFICGACGAEYQVKAKAGSLAARLRDAAYAPMMERARANRSPHFAFLGYDNAAWCVQNLLLVPGHFITTNVIERCRPLAPTARRAGWVGCNIRTDRIPSDGRLTAVENGRVVPPAKVRADFQQFADLAQARPEARGWTVDVLRCVRALGRGEFSLKIFYERFEKELAALHPENHSVQPKIRQQLQFLRDRGVLRFLARGRYVAE